MSEPTSPFDTTFDTTFDTAFDTTRACAKALDARDPLAAHRDLFHIPLARDVGAVSAASSEQAIYLTGNSLGLMPKAARAAVEQELDDWQRLGVEGHIHGKNPWLPYHEMFRHTGARLVGAESGEVVMMNSLTANLHLLMVSFYRPTATRYKIIIEDACFPSDSYAVVSQAEFHAKSAGFNAPDAVVRLKPRDGESALRTDDILAAIDRHKDQLALVMLGGVNYLTSQWFDMPVITAAAKRAGAVCGWDLAHAAGNVPLDLHRWDVDFAAWCSYKFLNGGPGAIAGAYVHDQHARRVDLPRFAGWWGNDASERFLMRPEFVPRAGVEGWQLSNPPILAMAPLRVSLEIFDKAGMSALRAKSLLLTGYLEFLIDRLPGNESAQRIGSLTPRTPADRGCALSLVIKGNDPKAALHALKAAGAVCDFRQPNVIRAAPVPLYNSFDDVWRFADVLAKMG